MVQTLDAPVSPGSQGEIAYGWLREGKARQPFRNQLLKLTREDIIEAVEQVIVPQFDKGTTVIFAGNELLEKANHELAAEGRSGLVIEGI